MEDIQKEEIQELDVIMEDEEGRVRQSEGTSGGSIWTAQSTPEKGAIPKKPQVIQIGSFTFGSIFPGLKSTRKEINILELSQRHILTRIFYT